MVEVPITIACGNYDRTRAIRDGRVAIEGCATTYLPLYPEEIFFRAFRYQEFDVSRALVLELHPHGGGGHLRLCRGAGLRVADLPAFRHLHSHRCRHPQPGRPARQAHRAARVSDHRGGLDARHDAARIRRGTLGDSLAQRRPGGGRAARAYAAQADRGHRPATDRGRPDPGRHAAGRRARRPVHGARALVLPQWRAPYRPPVSRYPGGREGLFQEDRPVPDHASDRHPQSPGGAVSLAADQRLQGVLRGQGARHGGSARRQRPDGHFAVAGGGNQRDDGGDGPRLLEIRDRGEHAGDRSPDPICL